MDRSKRDQLLLTAAACIWLVLGTYTFVSGEYRTQSDLRNALNVFVIVLSLVILWRTWMAPTR